MYFFLFFLYSGLILGGYCGYFGYSILIPIYLLFYKWVPMWVLWVLFFSFYLYMGTILLIYILLLLLRKKKEKLLIFSVFYVHEPFGEGRKKERKKGLFFKGPYPPLTLTGEEAR